MIIFLTRAKYYFFILTISNFERKKTQILISVLILEKCIVVRMYVYQNLFFVKMILESVRELYDRRKITDSNYLVLHFTIKGIIQNHVYVYMHPESPIKDNYLVCAWICNSE